MAAPSFVTKWVEHAPVDWEDFGQSEDSKFYMPLDTYCTWQRWDAFGDDTAGAVSSSSLKPDYSLDDTSQVQPYIEASQHPDGNCHLTPAMRKQIGQSKAQALRRKARKGLGSWARHSAGPVSGTLRAPVSRFVGGPGHPPIKCDSCFGMCAAALMLENIGG